VRLAAPAGDVEGARGDRLVEDEDAPMMAARLAAAEVRVIKGGSDLQDARGAQKEIAPP
jgi:hypothetical protein